MKFNRELRENCDKERERDKERIKNMRACLRENERVRKKTGDASFRRIHIRTYIHIYIHTHTRTHFVPKIHDCLFWEKSNGRQTLISL